MHSGPPGERPNDAWAVTARSHLEPLTEAMARVEIVLAAGKVTDNPLAELASEVVVTIKELSQWLRGSEPPESLRTAAGELAAAAGVYRNAASLIRSLPDAESGQLDARLTACSNMLSLGAHHVEVFTDELRSHGES